MLTMLRKGLLTAACVSVAPLLLGSASDANAHTYVSGSISFGSPGAVAVFGYSNANPYSFGHVHSEPIYCDEGPLYYYPAYHVYAHYYPRVHYYSYSRPRYFYPRYYAPHPRYYAPHYRGGYSRGGYSRGYVSEIRGHRPGRSGYSHGYVGGGSGYGHGKSRGHGNGNGNGKYKGSHDVRGHGDR